MLSAPPLTLGPEGGPGARPHGLTEESFCSHSRANSGLGGTTAHGTLRLWGSDGLLRRGTGLPVGEKPGGEVTEAGGRAPLTSRAAGSTPTPWLWGLCHREVAGRGPGGPTEFQGRPTRVSHPARGKARQKPGRSHFSWSNPDLRLRSHWLVPPRGGGCRWRTRGHQQCPRVMLAVESKVVPYNDISPGSKRAALSPGSLVGQDCSCHVHAREAHPASSSLLVVSGPAAWASCCVARRGLHASGEQVAPATAAC